MKKDQQRDIRSFRWFIRKLKKNEWLLNTPFMHLEKFYFPNHRILSRKDYFRAVMESLGKSPSRPLPFYREELMTDEPLRKKYLSAVESGIFKADAERYEDRFSSEGDIVNSYALFREVQPEVVLETGTATGATTSWLLTALHKNRKGRLLSIDLPAVSNELTMSVGIKRDNVGMLIPEAYRDRWEYHEGDAKILLPKLLVENAVDVFIHDSLHTRTHMLFEYNCARALMKPGTIIMSDDITWNQAFFLFVKSHKLEGLSCISNPNRGFTVNRFEEYEEHIGTGVVRRPT